MWWINHSNFFWNWGALMSDAMPDGDVIHLPPPKRQPPRAPHLFGEAVMVPATLTRHQQTERTCAVCGAVRVTVHGDNAAWREWRQSADAEQGTVEIACKPVLGAAP